MPPDDVFVFKGTNGAAEADKEPLPSPPTVLARAGRAPLPRFRPPTVLPTALLALFASAPDPPDPDELALDLDGPDDEVVEALRITACNAHVAVYIGIKL